MALYCTEEAERRQHLRAGRRLDYQQLIGTQRGEKPSGVDDSFREIGPVLAGQSPSLQLMASGEATHLVLQAASECGSRGRAGKVFIPLFK